MFNLGKIIEIQQNNICIWCFDDYSSIITRSSLHPLHASSFVYRPLHVWMLRILVFPSEDRHTTVLSSTKPPIITSFLSWRDCRACDSHALSLIYWEMNWLSAALFSDKAIFLFQRRCWSSCYHLILSSRWTCTFTSFLSCRFNRVFIVISIKHINNTVRISGAVKKCIHVNIC